MRHLLHGVAKPTDARYRRPRRAAAAAAALMLSGPAIAMQGPAETAVLVTQKSRTFTPGSVELQKGQSLRIVNDDGRLLHHAYIASPDFHFDSGEQLPGATIEIRFPAPGEYLVRCGIHPKMRLSVKVD